MATVVTVTGVYEPYSLVSITGQVVSGDGHVSGGLQGSPFGVLTILPPIPPVALGGVPSAQSFGVPTPITRKIVPLGGVASAQLFGIPSLRLVQFVALGGVNSAQLFGALTLHWWQPAHVGGVPSAQQFGPVTIKTRISEPTGGVPTAQSFGAIWLVYPQWQPVGGVPSAQSFGSTTTGLAVFHVWLHESDCISSPNEMICGVPICGGLGVICGGINFIEESDCLEGYLDPEPPALVLDLQSAGCS
jgi:hypothetical protein